MRSNRRLAVALVAVLAGGSLVACSSGGGEEIATLDLKTGTNSPLTITAAQLAGLAQGGAVVDVKPTADGTIEAAKGGALVFKPKAGFTGSVQLTAVVSPAVALYSSNIPPLATIGGVSIDGSGYGSSWTPVPGAPGEFYGLTDRGPNVDGPGKDEKVAVMPDFTPQIGRFKLEDGAAVLQSVITLKGRDGRPLNGLNDTAAPTGERMLDLDGAALPPTDHGIDSEGLVALPDGSFWVSDEYGPFLIHFDANGQELERLLPGRGLPEVLRSRTPNQGMEGLTVTPDGKRLVGIIQSALNVPGLSGNAKEVPVTRIVAIDLATKAVQQYAYLLDNPKDTKKAVSEITAISDTEFLVDERDGKLAPKANKTIYRISLDGATPLGERNPETIAGVSTTVAAEAALKGAGITPVRKTVALDLSGLVDKLNPAGKFFGHDKVEGLSSPDGGKTLFIANDSDFGLAGIAGPQTPYQLKAKVLANGLQDSLEVLKVDTTKLNEPTAERTITVTVG
ncbi:esterase-like activity of phytase family protein [Tsukamurella asaccharolytica]|uniref:Esterase-like activity of phytase family protein n=1 Tax=Tsukamurella asaccharolytica TaxID=2592067 RepID=A0A5C5RE78_9ACTN|nr:esterase-like activity of phytase family protein [Tsukamurella asaccharolytica]TWS20743.1 esterase-like activity of phytase family protein [Tsukamurella asaccharolytica]